MSLQKQAGLTLIEVLIALAIVGIALTAIIKTTTQNIYGTSYLQTKTIATWVGQTILNQAKTGLITLPKSKEEQKNTITILNRKWYWEGLEEPTANHRIKKLQVNIYSQDEAIAPSAALESYVYHEEIMQKN